MISGCLTSYRILRLETANLATGVHPLGMVQDFWREEERVIVCGAKWFLFCTDCLQSHSSLKRMHCVAAHGYRLHTPAIQEFSFPTKISLHR